MKTLLSILLGLMLVTSTLVAIAYATPIVKPTQNNNGNNTACSLYPNTQNYNELDCHGAHSGGNNDPHHPCDSIMPDRQADEFQTLARTCGQG